MTLEEALVTLRKDRDLCLFNPITGEEIPMNEDCKRSAEAIALAIEALEKQMPKRPYDINREMRSFDCPHCLSSLYAEDELENVGYCCICGQALDWSLADEEEAR